MAQTGIVTDPAAYGLHLLGAVIPFPPAPALWALAALDIAATVWVWKRPGLQWVLVAGAVVSAFLAVVGLFSIGPIYLTLFVIQVVRIVSRSRQGSRAGR